MLYDYFLIIDNFESKVSLISKTETTFNIKTDLNPEFTFHITEIYSSVKDTILYKTQFSNTIIKRVPKNNNKDIQQLIDDIDKNWFLIG